MTNNQIMKKALESPSLIKKSTEKGKLAWPARFGDKVPLKVLMKETVTSDIPMVLPSVPGLLCIQGNEYHVWVNSYGAVSAILPNGKLLGLKPREFEVTEWHNQ